MILKLDARLPIVWRSPSSVQVGIDPPVVQLFDVTHTQERVLAALAVGVTTSGLAVVARGHEDELDALMAKVGPALSSTSESASVYRVAISGTGQFVDSVGVTLAGSGIQVIVATDPMDAEASSPDFAILVHQFVVPPHLHGFWLRRDVPHLPVVFSETGVAIGPIVEPGTGPCLRCLELHRRDDDASWPAIASQLLGRRANESALLAAEATGVAVRMVIDRLRTGVPSSLAIRIDGATGRIDTMTWDQHPDCGCSGLVPSVAASSGPRGIGWPAGARPDRGQRQPTS